MVGITANLESVTPDEWISNENAYLRQLQDMPSWSQIPLLNSNALHNVVDGSLVRFRGMVQDMHNTEFYFESFEVFNSSTNQVTVKSGKYRDTSNIAENEKINYTSNLQSAQRQNMVVISIPGLNDWAQALEDKENRLTHFENQTKISKPLGLETGAKLKRPLEEEEVGSKMDIAEGSAKATKELKTCEKLSNTPTVVSREHLLNFPLPDAVGMSCIVKTYEEESLKLNDMIEVVGFLSVDPSLSGEFTTNESSAIFEAQDEAMDAETLTHNPPPSLVPRVHAVHVRKLEHCNPLCYAPLDSERVQREAESARGHLMKVLTQLLLGDELAAEYLICHLISSVYLRQDGLALGQFSLNLSNIPTQKCPNYTQQLYDILKLLVTKSYYLPMTLENLNTLAFLPKKDYECNRLTSGVLQLSAGTHLVLDETRTEPGRLDGSGVAGVAALAELLRAQRVRYDFSYYQMEFDADVPTLVMSEGKSMLPCEAVVPLRAEPFSLEIFNEIAAAATHYLSEEVLRSVRAYLTDVKRLQYAIRDEPQFVQEDFLAMRSAAAAEAEAGAEATVGADDLHRLLVLTRLVSLSRGVDTLTRPCWDTARRMESERALRLKDRRAV